LRVKKTPLIRFVHSWMVTHHGNKIPVAFLSGNEPGWNHRFLLRRQWFSPSNLARKFGRRVERDIRYACLPGNL
jgi:hypothetical protein